MGQGQACCTSKLKSLTNSAEYHPSLQVDETGQKNCWLLSQHGSHQALGGWEKTPMCFAPRPTRPEDMATLSITELWERLVCHPHYDYCSFFFFFASRMGVFWLFPAMTRFFF